MQPIALRARAAPVTAGLLFSVGLLCILHIAAGVTRFVLGRDTAFGFVRQFDFDQEANLPTYFSGILLLTAAVLLLVVFATERQRGAGHHQQWLWLCVLFLFLSADEVASFHEQLTRPLIERLGSAGLFYYSLVVVGAVAVGAGALFYFPRFFFQLPRSTRFRFLLSAIVYLGAALGLELVGVSWAIRHGRENLTYWLLVLPEEAFEMVGVVIFIDALMRHLRDRQAAVTIDFSESRPR